MRESAAIGRPAVEAGGDDDHLREGTDGMNSDQERPYIPAGAAVEDSDGAGIGVVRAVYPHYVAVSEHGEHPRGYRVPTRAIATVAGNRVQLSIPLDVLDPMTPAELTAFGLPEHGGEVVVGSPLEEARDEVEESLGLTREQDE